MGVEGDPEEVAKDYVYRCAGAAEEGVTVVAAREAGAVGVEDALEVADVGKGAEARPVQREEREGALAPLTAASCLVW